MTRIGGDLSKAVNNLPALHFYKMLGVHFDARPDHEGNHFITGGEPIEQHLINLVYERCPQAKKALMIEVDSLGESIKAIREFAFNLRAQIHRANGTHFIIMTDPDEIEVVLIEKKED